MTNQEKMQKLLAQFAETAKQITDEWDNIDGLTDEALCEEYPFDKSFEDITYDIYTWKNSLERELSK